MTQLAIAGGQPVGDVAQAVDRVQLAEQHRHQLAPTGKPLGVAVGRVLVDCDIEVWTWNQLQELRENAAYCGQGCVLFGRSSYRQTQPIRSMQPREVLIKPVFLRVESDHGVSPA
jgi:hypothetical protein